MFKSYDGSYGHEKKLLQKHKEEEELKNEKAKYMSAPAAKSLTKTLQEKADLLRAKDSFKEAAGTYLNSILMARNNSETYFGLGICFIYMVKLHKAIENL